MAGVRLDAGLGQLERVLQDPRARALRKHAVAGRVCTLTACIVLLHELLLVRLGAAAGSSWTGGGDRNDMQEWEIPSQYKCGHCQALGHNRRSCPQLQLAALGGVGQAAAAGVHGASVQQLSFE